MTSSTNNNAIWRPWGVNCDNSTKTHHHIHNHKNTEQNATIYTDQYYNKNTDSDSMSLTSNSDGETNGHCNNYPPHSPLNNTCSFQYNNYKHTENDSVDVSTKRNSIAYDNSFIAYDSNDNADNNNSSTIDNNRYSFSEDNSDFIIKHSKHEFVNGSKRVRKRKSIIRTNRPCRHCYETSSCTWRPGPEGSGTLCNTCGFYYRKHG
eukprot:Pgem_evm1s5451